MGSTLENRQTVSDFDPKSYYTFHNDVSPNNTLSSGLQQNTKGAVNMTIQQVFSSSENWQLYLQQGRYFIRNYDYGGGYQLGLEETSPSVPRLLPRSGALGQQWSLTRQDDGTWKFTNGLLGNNSALALSTGNTVPGMQPSEKGTHWSIEINVSAKQPKDPEMYTDVKGFEVAVSSSSSIASTTTATSTGGSIASATSAYNPSHTTPSLSTTLSSSTHKSDSLKPGAIAGIVIGAVFLLVVIGLAAFHLMSRRKEKKAPAELEAIYPVVHPAIQERPREEYKNKHLVELA
ncbi:uncharacterized protein BDR25DRAFT_339442 [Lindgomyces ingoldianus]|uniref:Uncharacterized protein n=1 Tax=Lindgomyces ingoldianus TaxID=673940 RepID=A0ACB6RAU5_9PLEO|nr:uncharacterized protein BDR25DRAFT_339442 [Lindgomyces ingoldianus]KAF2476434.1 hypothetical protein BDR25DRAFT_339442 [Lindgomyces ingoldianus]